MYRGQYDQKELCSDGGKNKSEIYKFYKQNHRVHDNDAS